MRDFSVWVTQIASSISVSSGSDMTSEPQHERKKPKSVHHATSIQNSVFSCIIFKGEHSSGFKAKNVSSHWELVKAHRMCFSCLRLGHHVTSCRSRRPCGVSDCKKIHHNLLHEELKQEERVMHANHDSNPAQPDTMDVKNSSRKSISQRSYHQHLCHDR